MSDQPIAPRPPPPSRMDRRTVLRQGLILLAVAVILALLAYLAAENLRRQNIPSGFGFLLEPAGFSLGEGLVPFESSEPYLKAFVAGLANTLRVALPAIFLCALLGTLLGIGRLSNNLLVRSLCSAYVEVFRNIPLLLQLLAWYFALVDLLPAAAEAWRLGDVYLSKSGLAFPVPAWSSLGLVWQHPAQNEFNIAGGGSLTPEYLALLIGLVLYSAAYLAEIVRAGIGSVPRGQTEAAMALGLSRAQALRKVVLPQALRVIIPSATNLFLSITKNSSLGIAVGYPELVAVANTSLNQSGRAIECVSLIMLVYLLLSLLTAWVMARYNRRAALRER
ncbi:MAG: ABC transporter permease subunit [Rhodocyclaceae bacterium]|nr:ABC transporter permease subunit [Rhodocyclaceae bacterium]